jgi:hypothetical protein
VGASVGDKDGDVKLVGEVALGLNGEVEGIEKVVGTIARGVVATKQAWLVVGTWEMMAAGWWA